MTFEESLTLAIISAVISAVVALITTLIVRWLDKPRPIWRATATGLVTTSDNVSPFWMRVEITNIGSGPAYDVRILNVLTPLQQQSSALVLHSGESLHGLALIPLRRNRLDFDAHGSYGHAYVAGPELGNKRVQIQYRKPPVYWILWRRSFGLAALASRARRLRNEHRGHLRQLQAEQELLLRSRLQQENPSQTQT
ncbi:MAG: hypothetical protein WC829_03345 [Hyphomicrobium sp.]|jgi:hypothetical protein